MIVIEGHQFIAISLKVLIIEDSLNFQTLPANSTNSCARIADLPWDGVVHTGERDVKLC